MELIALRTPANFITSVPCIVEEGKVLKYYHGESEDYQEAAEKCFPDAFIPRWEGLTHLTIDIVLAKKEGETFSIPKKIGFVDGYLFKADQIGNELIDENGDPINLDLWEPLLMDDDAGTRRLQYKTMKEHEELRKDTFMVERIELEGEYHIHTYQRAAFNQIADYFQHVLDKHISCISHVHMRENSVPSLAHLFLECLQLEEGVIYVKGNAHWLEEALEHLKDAKEVVIEDWVLTKDKNGGLKIDSR